MNNNLAPTHQQLYGTCYVLWYSKSNNYSIVEAEFKVLLDYYFQSDSLIEFSESLSKLDKSLDSDAICKTIETYLNNCNKAKEDSLEIRPKFTETGRNILTQYSISGKCIRIYFDSDLVKKTIHPQIAHLETETNSKPHTIFDVYLDNGNLCLFKDGQLITAVPKRNYHLLQGKFVMQLLCLTHDKNESDWISTFHGSTITNETSSVLFVGTSGSGKSTLCSLLASHGFNLVADDVSAMSSKDSNIYVNPSALSIKKGAFSTLKPIITGFDDLPITIFNKSKGHLKYVPFPSPKNNNYPCKAIVMVNYKDNTDTKLEEVRVNEILETLIPDSWLSPDPFHAKQFLDWLETISFYHLTYSDTKSVLRTLNGLFAKLDKS